ncbi:MAG: hypothetical protein JJ858_05650 [Rhizobiaceae bacterium]|nr:hypothetical protein [Rhizobiaceae bacterium]
MDRAKLISQAPVLMVSDIIKSIAYWTDKLGFAANTYGEPVDFAILRRDGCFMMLSQAPEDHEIIPNWKIKDMTWNAYFWVDDAKKIYEEFQKSGAIIDYKLHEKPYGVLEFGIQDLDDHDIAFGQDLTG